MAAPAIEEAGRVASAAKLRRLQVPRMLKQGLLLGGGFGLEGKCMNGEGLLRTEKHQ